MAHLVAPAAVPVDGRSIAFVRGIGAAAEIFVMDQDGGSLANISNSPGADVAPKWSPDGTRIAFVSHRDGDQGVFVMDANGDNQMRLASFPASDASPDWTPDGGRIFFARGVTLWVMDSDGSDQFNLDVVGFSPVVSPDANLVLFSRGFSNTRIEIMSMNLDGTGVQQVTNNGVNTRFPDWAPDGSPVAFDRGPAGSADIYTMKPDGTDQTKITTGGVEQEASFSPEGTQIVYSSFSSGDGDIFKTDLAGNTTQLTSDPLRETTPDWSPGALSDDGDEDEDEGEDDDEDEGEGDDEDDEDESDDDEDEDDDGDGDEDGGPTATVFEDGFEEERGWGSFEEIVGGSTCYGDGIGSVERSTDVAHRGEHSLLVWANVALSDRSNHLLANLKRYERGQNGIFTYVLWAYIDASTGGTGQTGPEFSLQNTREVLPGQFRTSTAGVQYRANPFLPELYRWAIWTEVAGNTAGWREVMTQRLTPGEWYRLTLEVDYSANRYISLDIDGPDADPSALDLSPYSIVPEEKFTEEAFWLTLEAENLWSNCGADGPFEYRVYYDDVTLHRR